jgi:threonine dehydratase
VLDALAKQVKHAAQRIAAHIVRTPLRHSAAFSGRMGADIWFKLENRQTTGSFKLRGATNRLLTLTDEQRARGCVAASSGNHGAAVACAMRRLGVAGKIFVPQHTSPLKVEKMMGFGATVEFFGEDGLDTEEHARAYAEQRGMEFLSPYNDGEVVAGQGTCGLEVIEDLPDVDIVFIAVGGGGLIGGVGAALKEHNPDIRVVGCQPTASPVMMRSIEAGKIVDMVSETTLSDGTAGGIEPAAITFALNQAVVDGWVEVSEQQIADAMRLYMDSEDDVIEGAAGVAIAGMLALAPDLAGKKIVVIICGGNVSEDVLASVR